MRGLAEAIYGRIAADESLWKPWTDASLGWTDESLGWTDESLGRADESLGWADESLGCTDASLGSHGQMNPYIRIPDAR